MCKEIEREKKKKNPYKVQGNVTFSILSSIEINIYIFINSYLYKYIYLNSKPHTIYESVGGTEIGEGGQKFLLSKHSNV